MKSFSQPRRAGHCGDRVIELSREDTAGRDFVEVRAFEVRA